MSKSPQGSAGHVSLETAKFVAVACAEILAPRVKQ